jgi:hypothetical protein
MKEFALDPFRFDDLARSLGKTSPPRRFFGGLAASALGLVALLPVAEAKKKHKHKGKKSRLTRNDFGCVDVGGACLGNSANCCSGICDGRKPRKGRKDTSVCVGHDDAGICSADSDSCIPGQDVLCGADNDNCFCVKTTGSAGFCGDFTAFSDTNCRDCTKDADCQIDLGPGAACVVLGGTCSEECPDTGRACVLPCAE